eukprot:4532297-Lingulodinium_polyedra.AAC.1
MCGILASISWKNIQQIDWNATFGCFVMLSVGPEEGTINAVRHQRTKTTKKLEQLYHVPVDVVGSFQWISENW